MKSRRSANAFTLIELLAVIAIIAVIASVVGPTIGNFRKGDAMLSATRQVLDAVARGRQLAISQRTTVYMVFVPTNFWDRIPVNAQWYSTNQLPVRTAATNLANKQLTGYAYVALRSVGDQPGQGIPRYLSEWQTLPEGTFIPDWKFGLTNQVLRRIDRVLQQTPVQVRESIPVWGFNQVQVPFPDETSPKVWMPCITFNYLGQLTVSGDGDVMNRDEYIPLAHGTVAPVIDFTTKRPAFLDGTFVQENPAGNSTNNSFNLIRIDRFTGRGRLERQEIL